MIKKRLKHHLRRPHRFSAENLEPRLAPVFDPTMVTQMVWQGQEVDVVEGQWIARFDGYDGPRAGVVDAVQLDGALKGISSDYQVTQSLGGASLALLSVPAGIGYHTLLTSLQAIPGFSLLEPNFVARLAATPNDEFYGDQWALNNTGQTGGTADADIDAPEAWDFTTGLPAGPDRVVVGVIDSGVDYTHPDLGPNMWTNPGEIQNNDIDDDNNGFVDDYFGWDFFNNDSDPMDDNGHGTHVSGTIGAAGDNTMGVAGVNWSVSIMALKIGDADGFVSFGAAIEALNYAAMMKLNFDVNIHVTNNSYGGTGFSAALQAAIDANGVADILFVAAAGNSSENTDVLPHYPSAFDLPNIISVASTNHDDELSSFSNFGFTSVDLAAPGGDAPASLTGGDILSTWFQADPNEGDYNSIQGTSMASPHVAGVAALLWALCPDATALEVRDAILAGVDVKPNLLGVVGTGGRLNAMGAIAALHLAPPRVDLQATSDSGRSNTDNVTNDTTATIDILTVCDATTVEVFVGGAFAGVAVQDLADPNLFTFTFAPGQLGQGVNSVTARATSSFGTGEFSDPLAVTLDTIAPPIPSAPDLLETSDTGPFNYDNDTGDRTPTFTGTAEANAIVRLFANAALVGSTTLGMSQTTYLVTSSLLGAANYDFAVHAEDLAGNVSGTSPSLDVTVHLPVLPAGADPVLIIPDIFGSWPTAGNLDDWMLKTPAGLDPSNLQIDFLQDSYANLITTLQSLEFEPTSGSTQTLFLGVWDWRAPLGFADKKVFGLGDGVPDIHPMDIANGHLNSGVEYFAYWMKQIDDLGIDQVDVIAFGAGGLLARSFIAEGFYAPNNLRIDDLILAGTPNHGATDAFYAIHRPLLVPTDDVWDAARDLGAMVGQSIQLFAPSVKDLQPQYNILGTAASNPFLADLNSPANLNLFRAAIVGGMSVTNLYGTGISTPQDINTTALNVDGDGVVLGRLSAHLAVPGVKNVRVNGAQQMIDTGIVGVDHASLPSDLLPQIFATMGLQPNSGFFQQQQNVFEVVDNVVFKAVSQATNAVDPDGYSVIEDAIEQVRQDRLANGTFSYVSAYVQPDSPEAQIIEVTDPNGDAVGMRSGVEFSTIPNAWQSGNGSARFILIPSPITGTYQLDVLAFTFLSASLVNADASAAAGDGGPSTATVTSLSFELVGQTTFAELSSNEPLSFLDADADWVTVLLAGPGFAEVQLATTVSGGDVIKLINLHGVTSASALTVSVDRRSGDGRTNVGSIQALFENSAAQDMGSIRLDGDTLQSLRISGSLNSVLATSLVPGGSLDIGEFAVTDQAASSVTFSTIGQGATLDFNDRNLSLLQTTHGTGSGTLSANSIGSITVAAGSFDLNTTTLDALGKLQVTGGDVSAIIHANGGMSNLTVKSVAYRPSRGFLGGIFSGAVFTEDDMGSLTARGLNAAIVSIAGQLSRLSVTADVNHSTLSALSFGSIKIGGHMNDTRILAGANLGTDGILGGSGFAADSFGAGFIQSFNVGGNLTNSIVAAGVTPGPDSILGNGNDTISGGTESYIKAFTVNGTGSDCIAPNPNNSYFAAGSFPSVVRIGGVTIDPLTDPCFFVG